MLGFLAAFASATYIELTPENAEQIIGGEKPAFVKFYSPSCPHCRAMAPHFLEASTLTEDVVFAGMECVTNKKLCKNYEVDGYPTLLLYQAHQKAGAKEFNGSRVLDEFLPFLEENLNIKIPRPPKALLDLTPISFNTTTSQNKCTLVTFYAPWCEHSQKFLPEFKKAAIAFLPDENVTLARVDCDQFKSICTENEVKGFPHLKLFINGNPTKYTGKRNGPSVMHFINKHCGTERAFNGLLRDKAGVNKEANKIAQQFIKADENERQTLIDQMKDIKGAEIYVKAMERITKPGNSIENDVAKMQATIDARKASMKVLDNIKLRLNVFKQFLPHTTSVEYPEKQVQKPADNLDL